MNLFDRNWISSIWKAVEAGQGIDWADFEWYAIDRDGLIGMFTSAGRGPVPLPVFRDLDAYINVVEFFKLLPRTGRAQIQIQLPCDEDWKQAAESALYGFDYFSETRSKPAGYYLIAKPENRLQIQELPTWVQTWLEPMRLAQAVFSNLPNVPVDLSGTGFQWL